MLIHDVSFAQQPDIQIKCSGEWTTPAWGIGESLPEGVYLADNNECYTFDDKLVTCAECKAKE